MRRALPSWGDLDIAWGTRDRREGHSARLSHMHEHSLCQPVPVGKGQPPGSKEDGRGDKKAQEHLQMSLNFSNKTEARRLATARSPRWPAHHCDGLANTCVIKRPADITSHQEGWEQWPMISQRPKDRTLENTCPHRTSLGVSCHRNQGKAPHQRGCGRCGWCHPVLPCPRGIAPTALWGHQGASQREQAWW